MKEIVIKASLFEELIAVSLWYNAMPSATPNFYAGDRFHENIFEFQAACISDDGYAIGTDDNRYLSHFEIQDGKLVVAFGRESGRLSTEEPFIYYRIVAAS